MSLVNLTEDSSFIYTDLAAISGRGNRKINFTLLPHGSFYIKTITINAIFTKVSTFNYPLNTWVTLKVGSDFSFGAMHRNASEMSRAPVYASVIINDPDAIGQMQVTASFVGDDFKLDSDTLANVNGSTTINPLYLDYEDIATLPLISTKRSMEDFNANFFTIVNKVTNLATLASQYKTAVDQLLYRHMNSNDNVHNVTAAQLGLDKVPNWTIASLSDIYAGISTNMFVTPSLALSYVNNLTSSSPLRAINDGSYVNDNARFLTASGVYQLIANSSGTLNNTFKIRLVKTIISSNKLIYPVKFNGIFCYNFKDIINNLKALMGFNYLQFSEKLQAIYTPSDVTIPVFTLS